MRYFVTYFVRVKLKLCNEPRGYKLYRVSERRVDDNRRVTDLMNVSETY